MVHASVGFYCIQNFDSVVLISVCKNSFVFLVFSSQQHNNYYDVVCSGYATVRSVLLEIVRSYSPGKEINITHS